MYFERGIITSMFYWISFLLLFRLVFSFLHAWLHETFLLLLHPNLFTSWKTAFCYLVEFNLHTILHLPLPQPDHVISTFGIKLFWWQFMYGKTQNLSHFIIEGASYWHRTEWCAAGGECSVVRKGSPVSNPEGNLLLTPPFPSRQSRNEIGG